MRDSGIFLFRSVVCRVETGTEQGMLYTHDMHVMGHQTEQRHMGPIEPKCSAVSVLSAFFQHNVATLFTLTSCWKISLQE